MGEAAYNEAKANGELMNQRLRKLATDGENGEYRPDRPLLLREAADLIEWLSKERDALIGELAQANEIRADMEEELKQVAAALGVPEEPHQTWHERLYEACERIAQKCAYCRRGNCWIDPCSTELKRRDDGQQRETRENGSD